MSEKIVEPIISEEVTSSLFEIPRHLGKIPRWSRWVRSGAEVETVLEHTMLQSVLTIIIVEKMRESNAISFEDCYRALACAILHDIGESEMGDILDYKKTEEDDKNERAVFERLFSFLDQKTKEKILGLYDVQCGAKSDDNLSAQPLPNLIFGLTEKLSYLAYSDREFRKSSQEEFAADLLQHVHRRQRSGLEKRLRQVGLGLDAISPLFVRNFDASENSNLLPGDN